ncbi:arylesterase [Chitinilyticum litopenaei]|uniref:arylesterase n=1 Tax=Chitinilyticum litopenaei TaxID=1121276 RepID=UPI000403BCFD|nr:arylesterase [Chitinilyticum litopenaei]
MRLLQLFIPLLALLLAACGQPELARLPAGAPILAFGDSLTFGTGASPAEAYPARLAALTGHPVINAGIPGETSGEGRARLAAELDQHQPALVLLCLGGNDFLQRKPASETRANLAAMLDELRARKTPVLLIGVPSLGFGLETNPVYAELAKQYQVPLNDTLEGILGERELKSDTVHPNAEGYRQFAEALAEQLAGTGALRAR